MSHSAATASAAARNHRVYTAEYCHQDTRETRLVKVIDMAKGDHVLAVMDFEGIRLAFAGTLDECRNEYHGMMARAFGDLSKWEKFSEVRGEKS